MNRLIQEIENILLKRMTIVIFVLIASIWLFYFFSVIDIKYSLTSTWAILAFWYWYKKYERDKEIELMWKNIINPPNISDPWNLIYNWNILYNLYKKDYVPQEIFKELENKYFQNFKALIDANKNNLQKVSDVVTHAFEPTKHRAYFISKLKELQTDYETQIKIKKTLSNEINANYDEEIKKLTIIKNTISILLKHVTNS